jgi:hypothetical protein
VLKSQDYSVFDADLTRGYTFTTILMKSKKYTSTEVTKYVLIDFIAHMTAVLLGFYWIFKIFYRYVLPVRFNSELETIQKVYRVHESQNATSIVSLKNAMQEMADRLQSNASDSNTLGGRLKMAIRRKLYEQLQHEIEQM